MQKGRQHRLLTQRVLINELYFNKSLTENEIRQVETTFFRVFGFPP